MKTMRNILIAIAVLFGLLTLFAGTFVLLGTNPGYIVFKPLLIYNTAMGFVYIAAGIITYRHIKQGMYLSSAIFTLNLIVLIALFFLYSKGNAIAIDSLRAMSLRTVVWLIVSTGLWWLSRRDKAIT